MEDLHLSIPEKLKSYDFNNGINALSQKFYETDKEFNEIYLEYIKVLFKDFFKFPFYFQKTPTIRLHCPDALNNSHYPRYHSDVGYGHPPQEFNIWVPLKESFKSQRHGFRLMNIENTREILNQFDYRFDSFIKNAIAKKSFNEHLSEYAPQVDTNFGESLIFDSRCLHTGEPLIMHTRV